MKNRLACIVLMLIVLACAVSFAETGNRDIPFEQLGLPYFSHLCAASDALYFYRGGDVWRYDEPTGACIPLAVSGNEDFERLIYHQGDLYALTASGGFWLTIIDGDTMGLSPVAKFDYSDMVELVLDAMSRISLYPDENEPVEMAYYGENLESHAQDMAHYDELIAATANEDEALRLTRLKQDQQAFWEATAHFRYEISPQSIAKYREIAGQLLPGVPTFGAFASRASGFAALLRGFSAGEISAAEFIAKGERLLRMVRLETDIP